MFLAFPNPRFQGGLITEYNVTLTPRAGTPGLQEHRGHPKGVSSEQMDILADQIIHLRAERKPAGPADMAKLLASAQRATFLDRHPTKLRP